MIGRQGAARPLAVWVGLAAGLMPAPVFAASPRETPKEAAHDTDAQRALRDAERTSAEQLAARKEAVDRAAKAAAQAQKLARERVDAAAKLRQAEAATAEIATKMDALGERRRQAEQRVQARAAALQPLLPLIERLSLYPAETLLAVPAPPDQALRGVLVLQGLSRQIEIETEALRRDQADVDAAIEALRLAAPRLDEAAAAQKRQADALDQAIDAAHSDAGRRRSRRKRSGEPSGGGRKPDGDVAVSPHRHRGAAPRRRSQG